MIPGAVRAIYAGRRPAYPGAGLTKVLYLVLSSVRDTAMKKDDSRRGTYHLCGPEARVPGCRLDEGSLLCLVVRSRYGDDTGSSIATACLSEESSHGVEAAVRLDSSFSAT